MKKLKKKHTQINQKRIKKKNYFFSIESIILNLA